MTAPAASVSRPPLIALALLPVLVLGGCGSSDEDEVREAYDRFTAAIEQRDGKAACAAFTPAARSATAQTAGYRNCEQVIDSLSRARRNRFAGAEVDVIELDGDRAQLLFADGRAAPVVLERIDGTWKVATGPPPG